MGEVIEGPWTRDWHCPTCARRAPLYLPNGARNRVGLTPDAYCLDLPEIRATAEENGPLETVEVCWSCGESVPYLVGSLVVPYGQQGTVLAGAGRPDTEVIGAVLPSGSRHRSGSMLFFGGEDGRLVLVEREPLAAFTAGRLTSPEEQGDIPAPVWRAFQQRLEWLKQREDLGREP